MLENKCLKKQQQKNTAVVCMANSLVVRKKTEQNPRVDIGCARVLGTVWMQRSSQQWSAVEWGGRTDSTFPLHTSVLFGMFQ